MLKIQNLAFVCWKREEACASQYWCKMACLPCAKSLTVSPATDTWEIPSFVLVGLEEGMRSQLCFHRQYWNLDVGVPSIGSHSLNTDAFHRGLVWPVLSNAHAYICFIPQTVLTTEHGCAEKMRGLEWKILVCCWREVFEKCRLVSQLGKRIKQVDVQVNMGEESFLARWSHALQIFWSFLKKSLSM